MSPQKGDLWMFGTSDSAGKYNRNNGHNNYGFSGYIVVVVFNGSNWCRLTRGFLESIGVRSTSYEYRYECDELMANIEGKLAEFCRKQYIVKYWPWRNKLYAKLAEPESLSVTAGIAKSM